MSTKLRDRYVLKPGQLWCFRGGGKFRVKLDRCLTCDARKGCNEYSAAAKAFNEPPGPISVGPINCPDDRGMDFEPPEPFLSTTSEELTGGKVTKPETRAPTISGDKELLMKTEGLPQQHDQSEAETDNDSTEPTSPMMTNDTLAAESNGDADNDTDGTQKSPDSGGADRELPAQPAAIVGGSVAGPRGGGSPRTMVGTQAVPLESIIIDEALYPRHCINEENIERLVGIGPGFHAPIIVSEAMVLVDGRHRVEALKRDGATNVEVEVYQYGSNEELLEHAVEINSQHGQQLSRDEKKDWLQQVWSPTSDKKLLARILGVSARTIENLTKDVRAEQRRDQQNCIETARQQGTSIKETAAAAGVSTATVKRVAQKRKASQMSQARDEHSGGETLDIPAPEPVLAEEQDTAAVPDVEPEPEMLPEDPRDSAGDVATPHPQEWSEAGVRRKMQGILRTLREVRKWYGSKPGPKVFMALYYTHELTQMMGELAKWDSNIGSRFLDGHRRIRRRSNGRK